VSAIGSFVILGGMVVRYLRMLGSVRMFALFMGIGRFSMRFSRFFMMLGCFVVIVFWHFVSCYGEHSSGPYLAAYRGDRFWDAGASMRAYLLFTPMLAEVAGSSLEPSHISTPLRTSLRHTQVIRGRVSEVDLDGRRIKVAMEGGGVRELIYGQVVFALGVAPACAG